MSKNKARSAQAQAAWNRHGGAHSLPGRPRTDEEQDLDERMNEIIFEGSLTIDGEEVDIEWDWNDEEGEDDDTE